MLTLRPSTSLIPRLTNPLVQEAVDGAIRILGSRRKLASKNGNSSASIPGYLREYLEAVANRHSLAPAALVAGRDVAAVVVPAAAGALVAARVAAVVAALLVLLFEPVHPTRTMPAIPVPTTAPRVTNVRRARRRPANLDQ